MIIRFHWIFLALGLLCGCSTHPDAWSKKPFAKASASSAKFKVVPSPPNLITNKAKVLAVSMNAEVNAAPVIPRNACPLAWDASASPEVVGYKIYHGLAAGTGWDAPWAIGNQTTLLVTNLSDGGHRFAATAVGPDGLESDLSNIVLFTVGTNQPPPQRLKGFYIQWQDPVSLQWQDVFYVGTTNLPVGFLKVRAGVE